MFPFREIERTYQYQNSESLIFERLNELTYDGYGRILAGNFTFSDPPTFELYHPGELLRRGRKPFATKVTVIIETQNGEQLVFARTSTNPTYWILLIFLIIPFIAQLFRMPSLSFIGNLVILIAIPLWDRFIKRQTLKRLENVLP